LDLEITALAPSVVYELAKADLRPTLEARPQIAQELGRVLAQRLATGRALSTADLDTTAAAEGLSAWLSQRVHRLFALNSAD
jgi:CRP-like cAMP-binding protein